MNRRIWVGVAASVAVALAGGVAVQGIAAQGPDRPEPAPAPRGPDGRVSFTGSPDDVGNWQGPAAAALFYTIRDGRRINAPSSLPTNPTVDEIPFKPGFREIYDARADQSADPHTRCKPSGGSRFWHTPYGIEIFESPETNEVFFLHVGSPHSWRVAYMDGREHPAGYGPSWYGHTTGKWEGETLVLDTVGFNEKFWLTREGVPVTSQLHLIEKLSRPNHDELIYEATVDDPGAYTAPWTGGWSLRWGEGSEPFDYLCQENNRDPGRMLGSGAPPERDR
ncbi:MAG: hypothetical protein LBE59_10755 [Nevskiaceae bacterium]|nr:hypothetical protein [Nevskiaceae bacterium]